MVSANGKLYIITNEDKPGDHRQEHYPRRRRLGRGPPCGLLLAVLDVTIFVVVNNQDGTVSLFSVAIK